MRKVYQTKLGGILAPPGRIGNCFAACIASIFELSLEEVPDYTEAIETCSGEYEIGWSLHWTNINNMLMQKFDVCMCEVSFKGLSSLTGFTHLSRCYHMICGKSIRGTPHAVVGLGGEIVHDPHPESLLNGLELKSIDAHIFFVKLNSRNMEVHVNANNLP